VTVRLLGICGSLQAQSSNLALLHAAVEAVPPGVELVVWDGLRHIPPFDPDVEAAGFPAAVAELKHELGLADGVLIACPEYVHGVPGSVKNALDWLVGSMDIDRKPMVVTASVNHPARGLLALESLTHTLEVMGAVIVGSGPIVRGGGADEQLRERLAQLIAAAH
jgi:NAD(P)H-dependent FMN reductase